MSINDLSANLRLLCSHMPSISEVSRQLNINRQQLHRYLNGKSMPSLKNLRRICDYFGVEESEIFLDHEEFRHIIAIRKPKIADLDPLGNYISKMSKINPDSTDNLEPYTGFYYSYCKPHEFANKVMRSLIKVFSRNGFVYCKTIENYARVLRHKKKRQKYTGILFHTGDNIFVFERETDVGKMMWCSIFHPIDADQSSELSGLTMGVTGGIVRDIACYRVVWERIGKNINIRNAIRSCGIYDQDDDTIPQDISVAIDNDVSSERHGFLSRRWE